LVVPSLEVLPDDDMSVWAAAGAVASMAAAAEIEMRLRTS
jgi:predicted alpha/beta hydrolase